MGAPRLRVIEGGGVQAREWLEFPRTLLAKSPHDPAKRAHFRVSKEAVAKGAKVGLRQPIFDFWSGLRGVPPPVPNVASLGVTSEGLSKLVDAHACFCGIRRPLAEDDAGDHVLAYVLRPKYLFQYEPGMVCVVKRREIPAGLVLVAYVRLDEPCAVGPPDIKGVLTHWQFVQADARDPSLPVDHENRYIRRLW